MFQLIGLSIFLFIAFKMYTTFKIKWRTFLKKGFRPNNDRFGVYCYVGKQGKGKTYSVVEFLMEQPKGTKIYSNIHSITGVEYEKISGFEQLLKLDKEHDCIIVYDEIFTALTKTSRMTKEVLSFLSQMRKRRIIFVTTAQEWLEINLTLRRYCRFQIDCDMRDFFITGILLKRFYDAEALTFDKDQMEYVAPLYMMTISKCNIEVANSYDTYERIYTD